MPRPLQIFLTVTAVVAAAAAAAAISALAAAVSAKLFRRGFLTCIPVGGDVENCTGDGSDEKDDEAAVAIGVVTAIIDNDDEEAELEEDKYCITELCEGHCCQVLRSILRSSAFQPAIPRNWQDRLFKMCTDTECGTSLFPRFH